MHNGRGWNVRNVTAEWWVICGMRKVASRWLDAVSHKGAGA